MLLPFVNAMDERRFRKDTKRPYLTVAHGGADAEGVNISTRSMNLPEKVHS